MKLKWIINIILFVFDLVATTIQVVAMGKREKNLTDVRNRRRKYRRNIKKSRKSNLKNDSL